MTKPQVVVTKIFTFESSHQLVNHKAKCANVHGHSYKLEVSLRGPVIGEENKSDAGFVMDFTDLKAVVKQLIVDPMDHAFLAQGNEPILPVLLESGSKVYHLGFRSTCENMAMYICHVLKKENVPVNSVKIWETATGWAEAFADDLPEDGPIYNKVGGCDNE